MSAPSSSSVPLVRVIRDQLGWTQEYLAEETSLSVRLIAYAEAGKSISKSTAERLAAAFQRGGYNVSVADLLANPATLARRFLTNYAKHQADCVQHSRDFLSPDIVAHVEGNPETNPIAGEYRGIAEFDRFWKKFFGLFVRDGGTLDKAEMVVNGNDVVAWGYERIRVPNLPPQKAVGFVMLRMRFEGGRMVRFEDYYEVNGLMNAIKRWVNDFPDAAWVELVRKEAIQSWQPDEDLADGAA